MIRLLRDHRNIATSIVKPMLGMQLDCQCRYENHLRGAANFADNTVKPNAIVESTLATKFLMNTMLIVSPIIDQHCDENHAPLVNQEGEDNMTAAAVRTVGLSGEKAFQAFREYAIKKSIEPTETNLRGWDLAHNNQGIRRSFGATDAELLESAVLMRYRQFLDNFSRIYIRGGGKSNGRIPLQTIRTMVGDDGVKMRMFIDAPEVTKRHLDNAVSMLKSMIASTTQRILFLGKSPEFIRKVVNDALEDALRIAED